MTSSVPSTAVWLVMNVSSTDRYLCLPLGTSGLGREAVLALSRKQPSRIYFTGRNSKAAADVIAQIKSESVTSSPSLDITFLECDHISLSSVELTIKRFLSESQHLDTSSAMPG